MRALKFIALAVLLLPTAEIAAFIGVASLTGLGTALVLLLLTSLAGVLVLRNLGTAAVTRVRSVAGRMDIAAIDLEGGGAATALGGILMVIPGFITGLVGAMVIFPRPRRWLTIAFRRLLASPRQRSEPAVIDLDPDQWRQLPSPKLPPRRGKREL